MFFHFCDTSDLRCIEFAASITQPDLCPCRPPRSALLSVEPLLIFAVLPAYWSSPRLGLPRLPWHPLAIFFPNKLFLFPHTQPERWIELLVFYPLFSVHPQDLLFRAFFLKRYEALLSRRWGLILANALAFGWAYVFFPTPVVGVTLTFLGGLLFADTYLRTQSLRLAVPEHALYGKLILTIGLGEYFFGGGRR